MKVSGPAASRIARRPRLSALAITALTTAILLAGSGAGHGQVADVVRADARGDYPSLEVPGPRGPFRQRWWLVVDPDPRGLWCRDPAGRPLLALRQGAVLETDPGEAPLILRQERPYLRVRVPAVAILIDLRRRPQGGATSCLVRAHRAFLAPIQADSLKGLPLQSRKTV